METARQAVARIDGMFAEAGRDAATVSRSISQVLNAKHELEQRLADTEGSRSLVEGQIANFRQELAAFL